MKKFIYLTLILLFAMSSVSAAADKKKEAYNKMAESYKTYLTACNALSDNFKTDSKFSGYLRGRCLLYQSDRYRMLDAMFPVTSDKTYMERYPVIKSDFAIQMNNLEMQNLKTVASEYCKYNAYRYTKKDPLACSRVNDIFKEF